MIEAVDPGTHALHGESDGQWSWFIVVGSALFARGEP